MDDLYRDYILEHYRRPHNFGVVEEPSPGPLQRLITSTTSNVQDSLCLDNPQHWQLAFCYGTL